MQRSRCSCCARCNVANWTDHAASCCCCSARQEAHLGRALVCRRKEGKYACSTKGTSAHHLQSCLGSTQVAQVIIMLSLVADTVGGTHCMVPLRVAQTAPLLLPHLPKLPDQTPQVLRLSLGIAILAPLGQDSRPPDVCSARCNV